MKDLKKLKVSLTKHGAHKVADLLERFEPDEVISKVWGALPDVNIDDAQARKTLSSLPGDRLPKLWHDAKAAGTDTIKATVLLGIVFSHNRLIDAMKTGSKSIGVGVIQRADVDGAKGFTNFKDDFKRLGFATSDNDQRFTFDITSILRDKGVGLLASQLFERKLIQAGWDGSGSVADQCIVHGFHHALGLKDLQFRRWIGGDAKDLDALPETKDLDEAPKASFVFSSGHKIRKTGEILKKGHGETGAARLIHNELQTALYNYLCSSFGNANVGSELMSGPLGSSIDMVRKSSHQYVFYEIKTSKSLRKCIREAIPQLLEYAFWPNASRAAELVIVTENTPTKDAREYLEHLRKKFALPLFHETIDKATGSLSNRI